MQGAQVQIQSLVGELKSHMTHGGAKKKEALQKFFYT